ncbi:MAG TPA: hypothetical protein HA254_02985 [Candidatus Diapherotrites archaeon]|uniref:Glycerophosphoryl diester phosphodiesterase membrane domain-containing protein n=1 Tax=Candidatus Iainarchaeum sp. TaxID=3101447 RepID=A0A7J4IXP7_9ARCH|nr:hypothetical protein [Candidatus Diapherotrites archaeon]
MTRFANTLKQSVELFSEHPKFIIPKLIIALLYSLLILDVAGALESALLLGSDATPSAIEGLFMLFFFTLALNILDILTSAMYPYLVKQLKSGSHEIHLLEAAGDVWKRAFSIVLPLMIVEIGFVMVVMLVFVPVVLSLVIGLFPPILLVPLFAILAFAVVFLFYPLYPVLVYEKYPVFDSLKRSVNISLAKKSEVGKATLISSVLSLLSFAIAFSIQLFPQSDGTPLFWLAFIIIRFLTAYVYSYLYVLNPVFYLEHVGAK